MEKVVDVLIGKVLDDLRVGVQRVAQVFLANKIEANHKIWELSSKIKVFDDVAVQRFAGCLSLLGIDHLCAEEIGVITFKSVHRI
jgi:hypothetical protein